MQNTQGRRRGAASRTRAMGAVAAVAVAASCGLDSTGTAGPPVTAVTVAPATVTVEVDSTFQFHATVTGEDGATLEGRQVFWDVSDPDVVTVNADGRATARAPGTARVAASAEGVPGFADVAVRLPQVQTVDVTPSSAQLAIGDDVQLTATPRSAHGTALSGRKITWKTSDDHVATVSKDGLVHARFPGTATITATCDGVNGTALISVSLFGPGR